MSNSPAASKRILLEKCESVIDALIQNTDTAGSLRGVEMSVWAALLAIGNAMITVLFARRCEMSMVADLEERGFHRQQVQVLTNPNHQATMTTTLGQVRFPLFAYREGGPDVQRNCVVRTPAKCSVVPLWPRCHSSELCLEWETRLGADHPFRTAQDELKFFTHGAVTLEDNTISAHLVRASRALERSWLYRKPADIADILRDRALPDLKTGKPVVYASSDAHALRRYVDSSCTPAWKMVNGLRLWCIDRETGEIIHLGGEFTWGDCEHVAGIFASLIALGILPADGLYGSGVAAQLCWVSDGAPWFEDRIIPLFTTDMVVVLDVYHLLEKAAEMAKAVFSKLADRQQWYQNFATLVTNRDPDASSSKQPSKRGGPRVKRDQIPFEVHVAKGARRAVATAEGVPTADDIYDLLPAEPKEAKAKEAFEDFLRYLAANAHRIDYLDYRVRGLQIGSGAMESLHRTGSQMRTKRPGAKWLAANSQAIFDWRMLKLVGRWDEFWAQANLASSMAANWDRESPEYRLNEAA